MVDQISAPSKPVGVVAFWATGNAGGAPTKGFYGGAGGTISLGLVFGHLAGRAMARRTDAGSQAA